MSPVQATSLPLSRGATIFVVIHSHKFFHLFILVFLWTTGVAALIIIAGATREVRIVVVFRDEKLAGTLPNKPK